MQALHGEFAIRDLILIHYFLGVKVQSTSNRLHLHQVKFSHEILDRAKMFDNQSVSTLCTTNEPLSICQGEPLPNPLLYYSIVGALQYSTLTQPDITYSVNIACQFLHASTTVHW